ncbi:MAG: hypothetical protein HYU64_16175 [Armatimonadetes bacterium]|nr:hypothetical protein [Armatimonadota bacterium]
MKRHKSNKAILTLLCLVGFFVISTVGCRPVSVSHEETSHSEGAVSGSPLARFQALFLKSAEPSDPDAFKKILIPPPFPPRVFPCSKCHKYMPVNLKPRKLVKNHAEIVLRHRPGGWCFDCHSPTDRDKIRLANGQLIGDEFYALCGQCHGTVYRDFKRGLHGKRTGMWNGEKRQYRCVHCHSPHDPHFKPLSPLPPPVRPQELNRE